MIDIPVINSQGEPEMMGHQPYTHSEWSDSEDFLDHLADLSRQIPDMSPYELKEVFFKRVCLTSLATPVVSSLVAAEAACSEYKYDITDDNVRLELLGFGMSLGDCMEAFDLVRGTRLAFQRWEMDQRKQEHGTG